MKEKYYQIVSLFFQTIFLDERFFVWDSLERADRSKRDHPGAQGEAIVTWGGRGEAIVTWRGRADRVADERGRDRGRGEYTFTE